MLEGSYPYITGGVSAWVQDLIKGLPEVDFVLFSISPEPDQELRYDLPPNVVDHKDIVLTETYESSQRPRRLRDTLETIRESHESMFADMAPDIEKLIQAIPEGYYMHKDAVKSDVGWEMITESNQIKNPLYPFSDYFWAWKSCHEMVFTILGASPPDADIYHAVSTGFAGLAALAAQIRRNKPFLLTEHGLYHKEREMEIRKSKFIRGYQRDMWINIYNELSHICYKNANRITALFEENRRKQIDLGASPHNTYVTPNGIDIKRFTAVAKEKREGFHVGLVGRVVPIKDIKTFISTAKIVLDRVEDAVFHCIGPTDEDPGYYEDCKLLVESLKISDRFHFLGRQNVLEYYSFLDVMVLTSVREAQPLVILEAYAAQVPVVSTTVGNVPEMLDYDDRFLAASKDSEKLAQGILYIHDFPEVMKGIIEKNLEKVINFYDKLDLHKKYLSMYEEMLEESG